MSLASDSSETVEVVIVKLGLVTASDMRMHHVLIILTLTFIHGHRSLVMKIINLTILETVQAMPIKFVCEDSPTKGLYDHCQSNDLDLHSRLQVHLKRDYFLTCNMSDNM